MTSGSAACARSGALEEQLAFACVARERRRALELRTCLAEAAELGEKVAPHARQSVVSLERRLRGQSVDQFEARCRTERHPERHCAIQLNDGRWRELGEHIVERRDTPPVSLRRRAHSRVTGG